MLPYTGAPLPLPAPAEAHCRCCVHRQERQAAPVLCQVHAAGKLLLLTDFKKKKTVFEKRFLKIYLFHYILQKTFSLFHYSH